MTHAMTDRCSAVIRLLHNTFKEVQYTKARIDVDCWTDHRIVISKMNFTFRSKRIKFSKTKDTNKSRFNIRKLAKPQAVEELQRKRSLSSSSPSKEFPPLTPMNVGQSKTQFTRVEKKFQDLIKTENGKTGTRIINLK